MLNTQHEVVRAKTGWLRIRIIRCLNDISTCRLLFQFTIKKKQLSIFVQYEADIISSECYPDNTAKHFPILQKGYISNLLYCSQFSQ